MKEYEMYIAGKGVNEGRVVLHSDLNNFFASVECKKRPYLKDFAVAVCGSVTDRHGIVLAKNERAKKMGVTTGQVIWQAKRLCPDLLVVAPNYDDYLYYSSIVRDIYNCYSDRVEPFGLDEAWIELTGDRKIKTLEDGYTVAQEIRKRVYRETGLTVSIGVSDNKVFSKLASDYKKPDAVTLMGPCNYEKLVSPLKASEMLFVGRATCEKFHVLGINTIGDIALGTSLFMRTCFGKNGERMFYDASGFDTSPVGKVGDAGHIKSVGNSITTEKDLEDAQSVKRVLHNLCEKVAFRLRDMNFYAKSVVVSVRDTNLRTTEHQCTISPTSNALEISKCAFSLFCEKYLQSLPVRSVGVRVSNLVSKNTPSQVCLFDNSYLRHEKLEKIDKTVDIIRKKYGIDAINRAVMCKEPPLDYRTYAFYQERHSKDIVFSE